MPARVDAAAVAAEPLAPAQLGPGTLERRGLRGDEPVRLGEDRVGRLGRREQPAAARGGGERPSAARPLRLGLELGQRAARFGLQPGADLALDQVGHASHVVGLVDAASAPRSRGCVRGGRSPPPGGRGRARAARGRRCAYIANDRLPLLVAIVDTMSAYARARVGVARRPRVEQQQHRCARSAGTGRRPRRAGAPPRRGARAAVQLPTRNSSSANAPSASGEVADEALSRASDDRALELAPSGVVVLHPAREQAQAGGACTRRPALVRHGLRARRDAAAADSRARPRRPMMRIHPSVDSAAAADGPPSGPPSATAASAVATAAVRSAVARLGERRPAQHHRRARRIAVPDPRGTGFQPRAACVEAALRDQQLALQDLGVRAQTPRRRPRSRISSSSTSASDARPACARSRARSRRSGSA